MGVEGLGLGFAEKGWRLSDGLSLWARIAQSLRFVLNGIYAEVATFKGSSGC